MLPFVKKGPRRYSGLGRGKKRRGERKVLSVKEGIVRLVEIGSSNIIIHTPGFSFQFFLWRRSKDESIPTLPERKREGEKGRDETRAESARCAAHWEVTNSTVFIVINKPITV